MSIPSDSSDPHIINPNPNHPKPHRIIIDGHRLTQNATGVGRYLSVLLNQWSINPDSINFNPIVIQRTPRNPDLDPWTKQFQQLCRGSRLPGLIWENTVLASRKYRHLPLFAPANLAPYRWNGPVVLVVHDTFCEHPDSQISTFNRIRFRSRYRRSAQKADLILTPSQSTASDVHQFFDVPQTRIKVISPGIPAIFKPADDKISKSLDFIPEIKSPYVLFVGKKSPRRQFPVILDAIQQIRKRGFQLNLVAVGPPSKSIRQKEGLIDIGYVPDHNLATLYQNAIALIWPSSREGFGLPLAEAMACGCPVITTPVNAISEVVGQACLALSECSSENIMDAIIQLIKCHDLRSQLILDGLQQANRFHLHHFADNVAQVIRPFVS